MGNVALEKSSKQESRNDVGLTRKAPFGTERVNELKKVMANNRKEVNRRPASSNRRVVSSTADMDDNFHYSPSSSCLVYCRSSKVSTSSTTVLLKLSECVKKDEDDCLVDFIGDGRWWVGLYRKLEGFSWRVWDEETEQEVYVGAFIVNNKIIFLLEFDLDRRIAAQICAVEEGLVVMGTSNHVWVMRVGHAMNVIEEMKIAKQTMYQMSTSNGKILLMDDVEAMALVFDGTTLEEVGGFNLMERREFH
ncbi:hypothetical protein KSP40_PGU019362 [Platanthera guangdongensis]|uniref:Uncharacterized protein n=1 Tax=Platanthera guangdongensis TaxID=2320717 RepID=A0ABR2M2F1_9ASPA